MKRRMNETLFMGVYYVFIYSFYKQDFNIIGTHDRVVCVQPEVRLILPLVYMPVISNGSVLYFHAVYIMVVCFIQTHLL